MKSDQRGFTVLSGTLSLAGAAALLLGGMAYNAGAVRVSVKEKRPGGDSIHLIVPAVVVPAVMAVIPDSAFRDIPPEARKHLPLVKLVAAELKDLPDGPLVEVRGPGEEVTIALEDKTLAIDVNDAGDEVHLRIPLGAVESVASRLASVSED